METYEALRISQEVSTDNAVAEQRLRAKCQWERMTRTAVIKEWGDPRTWDSKEPATEEQSDVQP